MKKAFWIPFSGTEKAFYLFLHIYPSDIFHRHPFPGQSYPHLPQILCFSNTAPSASEKFVNYSVTELPEHLNRGGIPPFSGCVHDTTTVYSFELYSYFYDFRCFQSGHGQFFFYSGYGEIFSQDIICADSIRIIILLSISV